MQRTFILFKPDAVERRLCGRLLARLEDRGLKIVGMKMLQVTSELAAKHYEEHVTKPFYPLLEEFITSGPVVALVAEGPGAVQVVRGMLGATNGRESAPGTIRGDFGVSRQMNLVHGSDGPEAAEREIAIYFTPEELVSYSTGLDKWVCADDEKDA
ncbi:MAG: nucleoside-diphosphate kinase [Planctomycetaceae bacterium]|nr:nucleoside-diphosphate kinase [Planctomycetaceae bacterium]MCB9952960.1 nucleoside-diphosphate kinase [Planctomycetaceae bacterium]